MNLAKFMLSMVCLVYKEHRPFLLSYDAPQNSLLLASLLLCCMLFCPCGIYPLWQI